jgi:hypothetical protein
MTCHHNDDSKKKIDIDSTYIYIYIHYLLFDLMILKRKDLRYIFFLLYEELRTKWLSVDTYISIINEEKDPHLFSEQILLDISPEYLLLFYSF